MADFSENPVVVPTPPGGNWPQLPEPESGDAEVLDNAFCPVVGIGASAGGLEAFTQFLKNLPADTGMAFVLVQHLDPHHESILTELLAPHTEMPVNQAVQGTRVQANHVYIIPPNTAMAIQEGTLWLTPRNDDRSRHLPIDFFLCSLAEDQKNRAFGVILSGSASDGTIGLKAIKSVGGITFAQDGTARFDSMPRNAIAASAVDFVLPPEAIARELAGISHHGHLDLKTASPLLEEGPVLLKILALLRETKTVDFTYYKRPTIIRRVSRRITLRRKDAQSYFELLQQDAGELNALLDDLLISVTEFFRDPPSFLVLRNTVFPTILQNRKPDDPIRIWVPGCSSGEEVYSIAICLWEYLEQSNRSFPIHIFGTDISERAIDSARLGKYSGSIDAVVSPERLQRFFLRLDTGGFQIARSIRELCVFSRHDLTKDPPLARMDLISCRNLLIYLSAILQRRVVGNFSYALQPTGCLMLGSSESLGSMADSFLALDRDHKIYTRTSAPSKLEIDPEPNRGSSGAPAHPTNNDDALPSFDREVDRLISEEYGPSGFLLDSNYQVIRFRGNLGFYIAPNTGTATLDVFKLVREDMLVSLRSALNEAANKTAAVRKEHVEVKGEGRSEFIDIVVRSLVRPGHKRTFLVLFEQKAQRNGRGARQLKAPEPAPGGAASLVEELASTRVYLQSLIEDLRTANEEAQSANEELQSTNEELQTAKEELQSSNEELTTTNDEMKSRNSELTQVNNDLLNLLSSMKVPVVMLNKDLRIRRFTPLAEQTLNLIPTDIGRPISDLRPRIDVPDLEQLLAQVILSVQALEKEVQDKDGHWYSMRIHPYRTADNKVEGAVMQLVDIDQFKRSVEAAEHAKAYSQTIFETVREPLVVLDRALRVETANQSFFDTFATTAEETLHNSILDVADRQWDTPAVHQLLREIATSGQTRLQDVEIDHARGQSGPRTFQLHARSMNRESDPGQILLALEDVSDRKRVAEAKYRRLFETAKDGILIIDAESGQITDVNAFVIDLFDFRREELVGKAFWEAGPLMALPDGSEALERLRAEEIVRFPDVSVRTKQGREIDIEAIGNIYSEDDKRVIQFNIRDITERKRFERQLQQTAKLESLGILAGGVAHDFNNLLTAIMGNASLLLDNVSPNNPDRDQLREIVKATQRAADLTRQMLAYAGKGRYIVELVDLSDLVKEISTLVRSSIPKTIELELDLAERLPPLKADATQIRQLVMNLVINAGEAIGEARRGAVRVVTRLVQLGDQEIRSLYADDNITPGAYLCLEITDSGSGMSEETKAKIFDPFFTTKFTGRGLGLSAVLGIVKGHRGAIRVQSKLGHGTTFKVLFPAAAPARSRKPPKEKPKDLRGEGLILIVDDEQIVLRLAEQALLRNGYRVLTAPNGAVALEMVRQRGEELTLIVLDLTMPVMSGEEAFLKIQEIRPEIPIVLSSGYDVDRAAHRFTGKGLAGFIQKPYSAEDLWKVVKSSARH